MNNPGFTTSEMDSIFSSEATVSAILEFEVALAEALAEIGLAPRDDVSELVAVCARGVEDPERVLASTWEQGTPLLALRDEIASELTPDQARWFHYGATTQDAVDTGLMLQARSGLAAIDEDLAAMADRLNDLTDLYGDQPHMTRTFLQDARPTSFGQRTAGWLNVVNGHRGEVIHLLRDLSVQLGGSQGARSSYEDQGDAVMENVARRLQLAPASSVWHNDRTRILSLAQALQRIAASMGKFATDIAILASTAIGEVSVRSGGSSSMPEKENPLDPIRAIAAGAACTGAVAMLTSAPHIELDRGVGGWHVEWFAIPLVFRTCAASVEAMRGCFESLQVDVARMSGNAT